MVGIVFSMISVVHVHTVKPVSQNNERKQKASVTILLMNVAYIITTTCMILNVFQGYIFKRSVRFTEISFVFAPILTSALNPVILFSRVTKIRLTLYFLIRSCFENIWRDRVERIKPVVINNAQINMQNSTVGDSAVP